MSLSKKQQIVKAAKDVLKIEIDALSAMATTIGEEFIDAVNCIMSIKGKLIVMGIGKSGHVARKIAATLSSTGTPAIYMHPTEAGHGDLGAVNQDDAVLAVSYSGSNTEFVENIIPAVKRMNIPLISLVGDDKSILATSSNIFVSVNVKREACPHNLAPTSSTTACMAMGDALAVTLLMCKNFTADDFAKSHPAGSLGKRLSVRVNDVMRAMPDLPVINRQATVLDAMNEMTQKNCNLVIILDDKSRVIGALSDGDIRRMISKRPDDNWQVRKAGYFVSSDPICIGPNQMLREASDLMKAKEIDFLVVTQHNECVGILQLNDLVRSRFL